ncbi:hypothetical protein GLOIN_2v1768162 [Rhizophagus irregularis DAOM 181602=DAOM 197198]|uniref:F-box domain-containing protein n=1 Tax=Rhizophagus irregularis (strain DAOM 181602 / DAOM 197198 / MUCL 43194) TaxID=747089 RepID=A0A2P4QHL1_RHIID|nr:hypothetical protein GLOIN_2v1768162 [Rhizophagus irregularis DAOM 181602=DAOM 197198]POG77135.1 hypothetical protein GLOIN_2v1768162 [Rhizophagus irregularis DAOM 181602=DAOM 197198]GBC33533.2 hypothetical protein GLOIN_2v1768162 [Rhizophagus irregularis DAOM 181602=DAOM 197198]|eukprot:XP_025184001.1 hypothetical protein GLOIN_2v1768162 [Rhizophagus irregularis DAOM 181602=DAOM 197198]
MTICMLNEVAVPKSYNNTFDVTSMACSKIFLGNLPELINGIIQYFHHDYKTLHSCILINRLWCHLAIPLLWENPFSIECPKNYHFIEIYLHNLNDGDKTKLNKYGINNDLIPSNTLFNYSSFIQHLNTRKIINSIKNWENAVSRTSTTKVQNLKFINSSIPLYRTLLLLKNSNCSNTLNTIIFYYTDFKNIIIGLNEVFNQLNVLESIHIVFCQSLDTKFIPQIINIIKPFKLKSLILNEILQIESLLLLIQKFGNNMENFGFEEINESPQLLQLLESVIIYCCKIKILYLLDGLNNQNINLVFNLIENVKQNLNYLFIDTYHDNHLSLIILQNLGQILRTFEIDSCEYILKKKIIKYLAIIETCPNYSDVTCNDLFFLEDKVHQVKLYDIQVLNYYSLYIDMGDIIYDNKYF